MEIVAQNSSSTQTPMLSLTVKQIRSEALGINSYELVSTDGEVLPETSAGSHLDVHLPGGLVRQYSLSGDPADRHRYTIAVLLETNGRGGSRLLHETLQVRNVVSVSSPRNNFALSSKARRHILVAAGIGITPLKAMVHELTARGEIYQLHYCARTPEHAAFRQELEELVSSGCVHFYYDGGVPGAGLDLVNLLKQPQTGDHLYYCGPGGFMQACANASAHWPPGTVHSEYFAAPVTQTNGAESAAIDVASGSFVVEIASTGARVEVPPDRSIVEVLGDAGVEVQTSCISGLCGSCKVNFLSGTVDHRDFILSDDERETCLTTCVSRATSPVLKLDL